MFVLSYPARFTPQPEGGFVVTFRDIPEAIAQGETHGEALGMASNALMEALDLYFDSGTVVPMPSDQLDGEVMVPLPPAVSLIIKRLHQGIYPVTENNSPFK